MSSSPDGMMDQAVRQSAAYATATTLSRATLVVALLVLPLILTPRDYGALSVIGSIAALVAIVVPLEVAQGLARHHAPAPSAEKKAWTGTAWSFLLLTLLVFLVLGQALAGPLCDLILGDRAYQAAFRVALALMAFNCLFYFLQNQCRWEDRAAEYVLISLVFAFLTLALSIGFGLLIRPPLVGVVLGQALGAALAVGLGAAGLKRSFDLGIDRSKLREMLRSSLPLVPASIALFLSVHASRLILNGMTSLEEVGLYTLAAQIGGIAALGIVGVQGAVTPLVMAHHQDPKTPAHLARMFELVVGLGVVACLALGLFAPEFIYFAGNPDYARSGPLVLLLAPAMLMSQMYVFAPGFAVRKRTLWRMWVSIASALIGVAANFALIWLFGITGAAVATVIASAAFILLWFRLSQYLYPIPVRWRPVTVAILAGGLLGVAGQSLAFGSIGSALLTKAQILVVAAALVVMLGLVPLRASLDVVRSLRRGPRSSPSR